MSLYKGTNSIKDSLDRISLKPPLFLAIGFALLIIISGVLYTFMPLNNSKGSWGSTTILVEPLIIF